MASRRIFVRGTPYKIEEEIGHGLHSIVYAGRDLRDGQPVAIKIINFTHGSTGVRAQTTSRRQTFWKEIEMLLYLQPLNPYVIRIFDYDHNNRNGIIIMERGETFRDTLVEYLLTKTPMPPSMIHRFWSQMVEAIYYMHTIGIVHGDCKPENFIQVGSDGTSLRLIDMGISFQLPPNITSRLQTAAGTPGKFQLEN
jgi:serine/threonine protein kinase